MARSGSLRVQDVRHILRIRGECGELGDDPAAWRAHLTQELGQLTGADIVEMGEFNLAGASAARGISWGLENGFNKQAWMDLMLELTQRGPSFNPLIGRYVQLLAEEDGVPATRAELVRDSQWYRSPYYRDFHSRIGADAMMCCYSNPDRQMLFVRTLHLVRGFEQRDFNSRDRVFVQEAYRAILPLIGGSLSGWEDPSPSGLPLRVRQVLRCLLVGDSDKLIARRMNISAYTVNQYVKRIYGYFSVGTRSELLARWGRRGWGTRFAWVEPEVTERSEKKVISFSFACNFE
jgi:DNA-binding CsgD family transcriptional regulator